MIEVPCASRRFVSVLFVLVMLVVIGGWWKSERDSCQRQAAVRQEVSGQAKSTREFMVSAARAREAEAKRAREEGNFEAAREDAVTAARYRWLAENVNPVRALDCSKLLPETG